MLPAIIDVDAARSVAVRSTHLESACHCCCCDVTGPRGPAWVEFSHRQSQLIRVRVQVPFRTKFSVVNRFYCIVNHCNLAAHYGSPFNAQLYYVLIQSSVRSYGLLYRKPLQFCCSLVQFVLCPIGSCLKLHSLVKVKITLLGQGKVYYIVSISNHLVLTHFVTMSQGTVLIIGHSFIRYLYKYMSDQDNINLSLDPRGHVLGQVSVCFM